MLIKFNPVFLGRGRCASGVPARGIGIAIAGNGIGFVNAGLVLSRQILALPHILNLRTDWQRPVRGLHTAVCSQSVYTPCQSPKCPFCADHTRPRTLSLKHIDSTPFAISNLSRPGHRNASARKKDSGALEGVDPSREKKFSELTVGEKVTRAGKDASYIGVIVLGLGIMGVMSYALGRELFSGQSPSGVYGRAYKVCKQNQELIDEVGEPMKGYGETTRRGRRRYVSHAEYEVDGIKHMRMKFYVEGPLRKGTVHLEVKQNEAGKYERRYLFVELDGYPSKTLILEDSR